MRYPCGMRKRPKVHPPKVLRWYAAGFREMAVMRRDEADRLDHKAKLYERRAKRAEKKAEPK